MAGLYDQTFTDTRTGYCQREVVYHRIVQQQWPPGKVLEINGGTGADAIWWAQNGWQVVTTDVAPAMVAVTQQKVMKAGLAQQVTAFPADAVHITGALHDQGLEAERFDVVFSNFGGINCLPPAALPGLADQLYKKVVPGGQVILVVMGRFCWWETLYFLFKGRLKSAFRRFSRSPVDARLDATTTIKTWYYTPGDIQQAFSGFRTVGLEAVGNWVPPSYLDPLMQRVPRLFNILDRAERLCRGRFWAYSADHFMIRLAPI